jgi:hypothetical protein
VYMYSIIDMDIDRDIDIDRDRDIDIDIDIEGFVPQKDITREMIATHKYT